MGYRNLAHQMDDFDVDVPGASDEPPLIDEQKAVRTVCAHASSVEDAALLLEMLGLSPQAAAQDSATHQSA